MLDASTFKDSDLINLAKTNFINLKIDAESDYGQPLFEQFQGTGYPLIVFLDSDGNELDRFYGYLPAYEFIIKMNNVLDGKGTFTYYLDEYNKNNHSAEVLSALADKYQDKGDVDNALILYMELLKSSNISQTDFTKAKYNVASLSIKKNEMGPMLEYLNNYGQTDDFENGVYDLINYYKSNQMEDEEIDTYIKYLDKLQDSYSFLNSYAWRMSEINKNLDDALIKVNDALTLIDYTTSQYPNILDTKAEILWKLGKHKEAIEIIQEAINLDPESEYYKAQKDKFLSTNL